MKKFTNTMLVIIFLFIFITGCTSLSPAQEGNATSTIPLENFQTQQPTATLYSTPTPQPTIVGGYPRQYVTAEVTENVLSIGLYRVDGTLIRYLYTVTFDFTDKNVDFYEGPKVSSTGEAIALRYNDKNADVLKIFRPDGTQVFSNETNLSFFGGTYGLANWSPDGNLLVFTSSGENTYPDLYMVDKDGQNLRQLTNDYARNSQPNFLPKGDKIFYMEGNVGKVLDLADNSTVTIWDFAESWTPDETYYFTSTGSFGNSMTMVNFTTRENKIIFSAPSDRPYRTSAFVTPDGKWVVIGVDKWDDDYKWYRINLNDLDHSELFAEGEQLTLTPDGTMFILHGNIPSIGSYSIGHDYYGVSFDGSTIIPLSDKAQFFLEGEWLPNSTIAGITNSLMYLSAPLTPTWDIMPEPPLYDAFDGNELDTNLWTLPTFEDAQGFDWLVQNGNLNIRSNTTLEKRGLAFSTKRKVNSRNSIIFQAKMQLWSDTYNYVRSYIQLTGNLNSADWKTYCEINRLDYSSLKNPSVYCMAGSFRDGWFQGEWWSQEIPVEVNHIYKIRIEYSSESGSFQYYLDGALIGKYSPESADLLKSGVFLTPSIGVDVNNGGINAIFDDVRLGP